MVRKLTFYDYFEEYEQELPYVVSGWVSPSGVFSKCRWGEHTNTAYDIVKESNLMEEFHELEQKTCTANVRDFLIKDKNYILLDNPTMDGRTQVIQYNPIRKHPRRQVDRLLELFEYNGDMTMYIIKTFMEGK